MKGPSIAFSTFISAGGTVFTLFGLAAARRFGGYVARLRRRRSGPATEARLG